MGIYGIAHEMMAGGDAPDDAFREYGTDYFCERDAEDDRMMLMEREMWEDIMQAEKSKPVCDWCQKEVIAVYPVYCTEVDPTNPDYHWCRNCINKNAEPLPYERSAADGIDEFPF